MALNRELIKLYNFNLTHYMKIAGEERCYIKDKTHIIEQLNSNKDKLIDLYNFGFRADNLVRIICRSKYEVGERIGILHNTIPQFTLLTSARDRGGAGFSIDKITSILERSGRKLKECVSGLYNGIEKINDIIDNTEISSDDIAGILSRSGKHCGHNIDLLYNNQTALKAISERGLLSKLNQKGEKLGNTLDHTYNQIAKKQSKRTKTTERSGTRVGSKRRIVELDPFPERTIYDINWKKGEHYLPLEYYNHSNILTRFQIGNKTYYPIDDKMEEAILRHVVKNSRQKTLQFNDEDHMRSELNNKRQVTTGRERHK